MHHLNLKLRTTNRQEKMKLCVLVQMANHRTETCYWNLDKCADAQEANVPPGGHPPPTTINPRASDLPVMFNSKTRGSYWLSHRQWILKSTYLDSYRNLIGIGNTYFLFTFLCESIKLIFFATILLFYSKKKCGFCQE